MAVNWASPPPTAHCRMNRPAAMAARVPTCSATQHRVPEGKQEQRTRRAIAPLGQQAAEHGRVLVVGHGHAVVVADEQAVEAGVPRGAGLLDHPPRPGTRVVHQVTAAQRDPEPHGATRWPLQDLHSPWRGVPPGIEDEPVVAAQAGGHGVQQPGGRLGDAAAAVAHEVVMLGDRQVEHRGARTDLDAGDHPELGEALERAVHGRLVEVGVVGPHRVDHVGGRHVM